MNKILFFVAFSIGITLAFSTALAVSPFDITFPIPELGSCAGKNECKAYCDDLSHKDECIAFARKHNLISDEDVVKAAKIPKIGPGGCASESECRAYCADETHFDECAIFAKQHDIGDSNKGEMVRERAKLIKESGGPGQCQTDGECRAYCENPAHADECLAFAEKHNLINKKEIKAARKVMKEGGPGGCRSKEVCEEYCENPDNMNECVKFAEEHELIDPKEAEMIKKMPAIGPGGCRGKECKTFCDDPEHTEECLVFAEQNGLMSKEELERAKKFVGKPGPGGCKGPQECRMFCENPDNRDACFQFAVDNDLMPKDEIEKIKKMKDVMREGGPGGCKSEQECRAYCENSDNQEKCFEFTKEHKLMPPEEVERMGKMREMNNKVMEVGGPGECKLEQECRAYCGDPKHVEECLAFAVKMGGMQVEDAKDKLKMFIGEANRMPAPFMGKPEMNPQGIMMPQRGIDMMDIDPEKFREIERDRFERFEQFRQMKMPPLGATSSMMMQAPMQAGGPGGCDSPETCMEYCADPAHRDECARFNPSVGNMPPGEMFRQMEPGIEREPRPISSGVVPPPTNVGGERGGVLCTQEYNPVCGTNERTYPNKCYAEKGGVEIKHAGPCGDLKPTSGLMMPQGGVGGIQLQGEEEAREMMEAQQQMMRERMMQQQIMPTSPTIYQQPGVIAPPPEFIKIPPQSNRNTVDYFFATIFEGFSGLFKKR